MKQLDNNFFEDIKINHIDMPHHREALKRSLLNADYWKKEKKSSFLFWRGGEKEMNQKKIATAGVGVAFVALIVFAAVVFLTQHAQTVYADQVVDKSFQAVANLTPDEQQKLKVQVHMDPSTLLQEAKNAPDLKILTYDEFMNEYSMENMQFSTGGLNGNGSPLPPPLGADTQPVDFHSLQFLQFTDANGQTVVVGVDKNNLPVFTFSKSADGTSMSIQSQGENGGVSQGFVQMRSVAATPEAGEKGFSVSTNDGKTINVNGTQYIAPQGADNGPSTAQVQNGNVFVNGTQVQPEK